jgi:hypothetical protein
MRPPAWERWSKGHAKRGSAGRHPKIIAPDTGAAQNRDACPCEGEGPGVSGHDDLGRSVASFDFARRLIPAAQSSDSSSRFVSCPGLARAPTNFSRINRDMGGRAKPGHDTIPERPTGQNLRPSVSVLNGRSRRDRRLMLSRFTLRCRQPRRWCPRHVRRTREPDGKQRRKHAEAPAAKATDGAKSRARRRPARGSRRPNE